MTDAPLFSDPALHEAGAVRIREERTAGDVLATAIRLALGEARPFFTALFAIVAPMVIAGALVRLVAGPAGELLGSVVDAASNLLATAAALGFVRLYMRGGPLEVADVWDEARGLLGPLLGFAFVLLGLAIALMIPVAVLVSAVGAGSVGAVAVGVLVIAAALVLTPVVSLALVAVGLDARRPLDALARARALARPRLGLVVLTLVLVAAVSVFVLLAIGGLFGALVAAGAADPTSPSSRAVPGAIGTLLLLPVSAVMTLVWVVLYGSLVEAEEGPSLGAGLDRLAHVLGEQPVGRPAPRDTPRAEPDEAARPIRRERPTTSDGREDLRGAGDARPGAAPPDDPDGSPPAGAPPAARGFRGGFSGGAA